MRAKIYFLFLISISLVLSKTLVNYTSKLIKDAAFLVAPSQHSFQKELKTLLIVVIN